MSPQPSLPPTDPSGVLDAASLARLAELDPQGTAGLVQRVLDTYATSLERAQRELTAAREPAQLEALRHLAHTLKSSSASVGALALSALCARVEQNVRSPQPVHLAPQLDALHTEMGRVLVAVHAMLRP
ncbi:MAG: Hpt domain-containing protein [Ideonella sp.]|nr:Hpt domain-containing protein [Ideonella sp.]MCC7457849.1 Hpt domain-containing protein [Nitrospira sp.]